jgi:cytochrome c oxidase subunit 1
MGWAIGVIPAIADGTIAINSVMHNTQWVPGHFHTYLLLGMIAMALGFMAFIVKPRPGEITYGAGPVGFWLYVLGGAVFVLAFLSAGSASVPRRYAVHLPQWLPYDRVGSLGAAAVVAGAAILLLRFFFRLPALARDLPDAAE